MENAILERIQSQFYNLKVLSDELRVQMALGQSEAKELIENEKKMVSKYISSQRKSLEKNLNTSQEVRNDFLTSLQNLEIQLNKAIPLEHKDYNNYKSNLLKDIYRVEEKIKEHFPQINSDLKNMLEPFKAKMDAFRVNIALHDRDNPEKIEMIRGDFSEKLEQVRSLLTSKQDDQTKIDSFVDDISTSFDYLKRAVERLN